MQYVQDLTNQPVEETMAGCDGAVWSTSLGYAMMAIMNKDNLGCGPVLKRQGDNLVII